MHRSFMEKALEEARRAAKEGEVPVGAVVVHAGKIIARGHNLSGASGDPRDHAEMIVLRQAHEQLGPRLGDAQLYVTLEPCAMCAGAIVLSRLGALYFGAFDMKAGATGTLYTITEDPRLNHRLPTLGGICDEESRELLSDYFRARRIRADR